jgi:hypothetical protein
MAARRLAEERATELATTKGKRALRAAVNATKDAVAAAQDANQAPAQFDELAALLTSAARARALDDRLEQATQARRLAQQIIAELEDAEEEEEALIFLMMQ